MTDLPFRLALWTDARPAPGDHDYARRFEELVEEARHADRLGFDSFWTSEVHGADDGYLGAQLPLLAGLATATTRIRLVTSVLILPYYDPRQIAEAAAVVDLLSNGRLDLGVGLGGNPREFAMFGVDFRRRARRLEDGIRWLRDGFAEITPRPAQRRVPILVGAMATPAVERAVELGDGTIAVDFERPEETLPAHWDSVLEPALRAYDRTLEDFRFLAGVPLWVSDDPERDWHEIYRPAFAYQQRKYAEYYGDTGALPEPLLEHHLVGTPEDIAERVVALWRRAPFQEASASSTACPASRTNRRWLSSS